MAGYGSDAEFTTWLSENGYTLPVGAPTAAVLRQRGSTYVDGTYGARFIGVPTGGYAQERAWPRSGALLNGVLIPDTVIPVAVVHASYEAALQEAREPGSLSVVGSAAERVKRLKAGTAEIEYADSGDMIAAALTPSMTVVEGLLAPFLQLDLAGFGLWSIG